MVFQKLVLSCCCCFFFAGRESKAVSGGKNGALRRVAGTFCGVGSRMGLWRRRRGKYCRLDA